VGHCTATGGQWAALGSGLRQAGSEEYQDPEIPAGSVRVCGVRVSSVGGGNMANGSPDGDMAQLLIICGSRGLMGNDYKYV